MKQNKTETKQNKTKPFLGVSSTHSSIVKMTARWGKGYIYIQMVWWINEHECSIFNVFLCAIALPLSGSFKGHKIGMGFFGGLFLVQGFFWVLLEALGIFLGLDFWLHSIIPVTWNPEYPPGVLLSYSLRYHCRYTTKPDFHYNSAQVYTLLLKWVKWKTLNVIGETKLILVRYSINAHEQASYITQHFI